LDAGKTGVNQELGATEPYRAQAPEIGRQDTDRGQQNAMVLSLPYAAAGGGKCRRVDNRSFSGSTAEI
jgi:hypothetical protein